VQASRESVASLVVNGDDDVNGLGFRPGFRFRHAFPVLGTAANQNAPFVQVRSERHLKDMSLLNSEGKLNSVGHTGSRTCPSLVAPGHHLLCGQGQLFRHDGS